MKIEEELSWNFAEVDNGLLSEKRYFTGVMILFRFSYALASF